MSAYNPGSTASLLFKVFGTDANISVVHFSANEWISFPYLVEVGCCTLTEIKKIDDILGKNALLTVINSDKKSGGRG